MRVWKISLCACVIIFTVQLRAQFEYGEVLGTVRDSSAAVVSRAKITLLNRDTNVAHSVLTNEQGAYSFPDLRSGSYEVSATKEGFRLNPTRSCCGSATVCAWT